MKAVTPRASGYRFTIYGLVDAGVVPLAVRYIGKTSKPVSVRVAQHIYDATHRANRNHRADWIRSALRQGHAVSAIVLGGADNIADLNVLERHFISLYRESTDHRVT